ncbi:recombinase family protein [Candidatus Pacearchaeota archaeon]|nr:recombinase family protein [Candidatus Pacearchaeota archaeon]
MKCPNCNHEFEEEKTRGEIQKQGMVNKALKGSLMSRPAFGYKLEENKLVPAQNSEQVRELFEEFLNEKITLSQLSKKYNFSINGLKKILTNFTYLGKIKFNNQIHEGNHEPIISSTLFNHVQNKLEKLGIKKP